MRIGYFVNQYPTVSHTFIRREIVTLEAAGVEVRRYALRSVPHVHAEDRAESAKTNYILQVSATDFLLCILWTLLMRPSRLMRAFVSCIKMGWRSDRGILRHIAYFAEATMLAKWLQRDKVDLLHAHFGTNPAAIAMFASQISGLPYSFTAHGSEEFEKAPLLSLNTKLENAAFAVCVSYFGRAQLMRWSQPRLWQKIHVVRCGLSPDYFSRPDASPDNARFVCVGRLGEHKAQLLLVDAVKQLKDRNIYCELRLVGDGPMRELIEQSIANTNLNGQIVITGWLPEPEVVRELSNARALVLPSFSENLPVVIMESFALGRPVISTYIAGIPEIVHPGHSGWLVPASDNNSLADAMQEALFATTETLQRMGESGRKFVLENHNSEKEAVKLKTLFERALYKGARPASNHFENH